VDRVVDQPVPHEVIRVVERRVVERRAAVLFVNQDVFKGKYFFI
jgi:hypothetical protein